VAGNGDRWWLLAENRLTCDEERGRERERERERERGDFVVFWVCFVVKIERKVTDGGEKGGAGGCRKKEKGK
jgi:hypothetical protein